MLYTFISRYRYMNAVRKTYTYIIVRHEFDLTQTNTRNHTCHIIIHFALFRFGYMNLNFSCFVWNFVCAARSFVSKSVWKWIILYLYIACAICLEDNFFFFRFSCFNFDFFRWNYYTQRRSNRALDNKWFLKLNIRLVFTMILRLYNVSLDLRTLSTSFHITNFQINFFFLIHFASNFKIVTICYRNGYNWYIKIVRCAFSGIKYKIIS